MKHSTQDEKKGLIFNIQRFSIHDGPGIRTTVFFKGCPLICKWCSNPEGINATQEIMVDDDKCIHCGECKKACPEEAVIGIEGNKRIDAGKCTLCMKCVDVCPVKALQCVGDFLSVSAVIEKAKRDALFYRNSGGGVTLSGGEALLQWEFARDLLKICKEEGWHTALDTTGFASWVNMREVLKYVDLVLYDIKHMDEKSHIEGTGVSNKLILENIEKTASMASIWIRIPVLPGYNDSSEHMEMIAQVASKVVVAKVSLLPYHEWGRHKYGKLGTDYSFEYPGLINDEKLKEISGIFEGKGLEVTVGS